MGCGASESQKLFLDGGKSLWEDLHPADTRGKEARTLAPEL